MLLNVTNLFVKFLRQHLALLSSLVLGILLVPMVLAQTTTQYVYDELGQLRTANRDGPSSGYDRIHYYKYDDAGNRVTRSGSGVSETHPIAFEDGTTIYFWGSSREVDLVLNDYDPNGRTLRITRIAPVGQVTDLAVYIVSDNEVEVVPTGSTSPHPTGVRNFVYDVTDTSGYQDTGDVEVTIIGCYFNC